MTVNRPRLQSWALAAAMLAAAALSGCPDETPAPTTTACTAISDCGSGEICAAGFCGTCDADVQCQADYGDGATCVDGGCVALSCTDGSQGCACFGNGTCDTGLLCQADVCVACADGVLGCACYPNNTCNAGARCNTEGVCEACADGDLGCPCSADGTCADGAQCQGDVCVECPAGVLGCACVDGGCTEGHCVGDICEACSDGIIGCPCDKGTCSEGVCEDNQCVDCTDGRQGCPCNADGTCDSGAQCIASRCEACTDGAIGCPCNASDNSCDPGATCAGGLCEACTDGLLACPCDNGTCSQGECVSGTCIDCVAGAIDCACLPNDSCTPGAKCGSNGVCFECPVASQGCACDAAGTCQPGLDCVADQCIPSGCTPGAVDCICETGDTCTETGTACDNGLCVWCNSGLVGCSCEDTPCTNGLVCDPDNQECREPLLCDDLCKPNQLCDTLEGEDPTCLAECEDGWAWNAGTEECDSTVPLTCTPNAPGSISNQCASQNRLCDSSGPSAQCGACLDFYVDEGGTLTTCRPVVTCTDLDCPASNRTCTTQTATTDAACAGCVDFYVDDAGTCLPVATCDDVGCATANKACTPPTVSSNASCGGCLDGFTDEAGSLQTCRPWATCASLDCAGQNKGCNEGTTSSDAVCTTCLDFFLDDGNDGCVAVDTCVSLNCATQAKECFPETATSNASCGGCLFDFIDQGGVCLPAPANCEPATPGSIANDCAAAFQECVDLGAGNASCGECLAGYALDGNNACQQVTTCVDLGCSSLNRSCEGTFPFESCGACIAGTTPDPLLPGQCNPPQACADVQCPDDQFCVDGDGITTGASCISTQCGPGEAFSDFLGGCTSCTVSCGDHPGETGRIWPVTPSGSALCICETRDNYYWDDSFRNGQACDKDGDGWVRTTARPYVEASDAAIAQNARCDVRTVDRMVLENEWGQRAEVLLCDDPTEPLVRADLGTCAASLLLPLYESERNDDQGELELDSDMPTYAQGGVGRQFSAAEVNGLTRACTQAGDVNDNGLSDIREWHGMPVSEIPNPNNDPNINELWIMAQFGFFMELHRSFYEPGFVLGVGQLVIQERSRCDADFPLAYGASETSTYWRECTRSRDANYDPADALASPEFGLDYARWSCDAASGSCPIPPPPTNTLSTSAPPPRGLCEVAKPVSDPECDSSNLWECIDGAVWRGMNHHSQFRCVVVDDTPSNTEPHLSLGSFQPSTSAPYRLAQCNVACPPTDPDCAADCPGEEDIQWTSLTTTAEWSARAGHAIVEHDGQLWLLGGGGGLADVWVSDDGVAWTGVVQTIPFPARTNHAVISWNNKLWVMGGSDGANPLGDVWSSVDGATWVQETPAAAWGPLQDFAVVELNDNLYVVGGDDGSGAVADVYVSTDGVVWSLDNATPFPARRRHSALVYAQDIYVLGGDDGSAPLSDVWRSNGDPALPWSQLSGTPGWAARSRHTATVHGGRIWIIGGLDASQAALADAWSSIDGAIWEPANLATSDALPARYDHTAASFAGTLLVSGGTDGSAPTQDIWALQDGLNCFTSSEVGTTNPSSPVLDCTVTTAPSAGTVGFALKNYETSGGSAYQRGCIDEWRPSTITDNDTNGALDPEVEPWRSLCPGYLADPRPVRGQGNPADFGALQCGCANNFGGINCAQGCTDDDLHVQDAIGGVTTPYSAVPREGWWLCGNVPASTYEPVPGTAIPQSGCPPTTTEIDGQCELKPAHIGVDVGSVWTLQGDVSTNPLSDEKLCETVTPCNAGNGWGSPYTCGSSQCNNLGAVDFATAKATCDAIGHRLCTLDEIQNNETRGSGCGYDFEVVWTASTCADGSHWVDEGADNGNFSPACFDNTSDVARVRCCYDACDRDSGWVVTTR